MFSAVAPVVLTEMLAPLLAEVIAVDTSPKMISVLGKKNLDNVTAICADIDDDSVRASAPWFADFDLIVASSVCNFLPDYEQTIGLLSETLKPGGKIAQWDWLSSGDGRYKMTEQRISNAFREAGLSCEFVDRAFEIEFDDETFPVVMGIASAA